MVKLIRTNTVEMRQGFTLVEMLVVMAIMTIIIAVVFFNHRNFQYSTELKNIAYDAALEVREMQVRGISTTETDTSTGIFHVAFGVHFEIGSTYTLYSDTSDAAHSDRWYDDVPVCGAVSPLVECIREKTFKTGYTVTDICATNSAGTETCGLPEIDFSFKRPNPDASILLSSAGAAQSMGTVIITSPQGATTSVNVAQSGQVFVE